MRHGSLFSGIGGFDLAAEWMGWTNVFHCEWNEFGQRVLKHYWPDAISYGDITKTDFTVHRGDIDILTGGFPCQPYSMAGKRKGKEDERHLWPEMLRAIREIKPTWVVGENVFGITNWDGGVVFNEVQAELEAEGYEVQPYVLPACAVNAPHRRDRVWFVAHTDISGTEQQLRTNGNGEEKDERRAEQSQSELRENGGSSPDTRLLGQEVGQLNSMGIEQFCKESNAPDTERGCRNRQYIKRQGQGEFGACDCETTPDTVNSGDSTQRGGVNGERQKESIKREQSQHESDRPCYKGVTANTEGLRVNRAQEHENDCGQGGERGRCNVNNACKIQEWDNVADPSNQGLEGSEIDRGIGEVRTERDKQPSRCFRTDWQNFPTVSPLCDRNDGLSDRLSGITFSKWRNESIKAMGNAIVPQVALQIFKAIEEFNNQTS